MDFISFGQQQRYIQIGTVVTDIEYRNKKLTRFLMEKILEEWKGKCEFIYLYANKESAIMYPKYGFERVKEFEYFKYITNRVADGNFEKLNMDIQTNRDKLYDYAKYSEIFGEISMKENADLVMFYCISILKDSVYYIKSLDTIAIATFKDNQLLLWDIFSKLNIDLDKIINCLAYPQINEVVLGFTLQDINPYNVREITGDALFIQKGRTSVFEKNQLMFPLLSHA